MAFKKYTPPEKNNSGSWLTTYSDMITLILVFFILIFASSQVDEERLRAIAQSYQNRNLGITMDESGNVSEKPDELSVLQEEVNKFIGEKGLQDVVTTERTEEGVILALSDQILFDSGEAVVKAEARPFLAKLSELLSDIPSTVRVEGHTDSRPISTAVYPSNWELSSARASSVIRYLVQNHNLNPERFIAVGHGDTRPVAPNDGPENWAKNRRVEIVILEPLDNGDGDTSN